MAPCESAEGGEGLVEIARPRMRRILIALFGTLGAAVAWTALSLFFGGAGAHAAERPMGLLDDLDKLVSTTTSVVTDTVDGVVAPLAPAATGGVAQTVTQVAQPVVSTVASVPVVGPTASAAVSETVGATTATVDAVVAPVVQTLGDEPVGHATRPVLDTLERLPIAGGVVRGLSPALASGVHGVDSVLGSLGSAAGAAVDPITSIGVDPGTYGPGQPPADGGPGDSSDPGPDCVAPAPQSRSAETPTDGAAAIALRVASGWSGHGAWFSSGGASGPPVGTPLGSGDPPGGPPGPFSTHSSSSSSAGSGGGAGSGAACIADTAPQSPRAWGPAAGAHDDALPSSPVFDTDVSPD